MGAVACHCLTLEEVEHLLAIVVTVELEEE
jgi:hypothetical protein